MAADNGPRYFLRPGAGPDGRGGRVALASPPPFARREAGWWPGPPSPPRSSAPPRHRGGETRRGLALTSSRLFRPPAPACRRPRGAAARPSREAVTAGARSVSAPPGVDIAPARQPPPYRLHRTAPGDAVRPQASARP